MAARAGHATGATTIGAAGGGGVGAGLGAAFADVLVEFIPRLEGVEGSVALIMAAALAYLGAILGGKFSPSSEKGQPASSGAAEEDFLVTGPPAVQVPETTTEPSPSPTPDLEEAEPGATLEDGEVEDPGTLADPVIPSRPAA